MMKIFKSYLKYAFLFSLALVFSQCKTKVQYSLENLPESYITYGNFGGFTGAKTTYYLLANGQMFLHESFTDSVKKLPTISKRDAKKIFKHIHKSNFGQITLDEPSNMSYFITWNDKGLQPTVVWGRNGPQPPQIIKPLHDLISSSVAKATANN